jgi:hypothetical protein
MNDYWGGYDRIEKARDFVDAEGLLWAQIAAHREGSYINPAKLEVVEYKTSDGVWHRKASA